MPDDGEKQLLELSDKQALAVQALVAGASQGEAAQVAGVTRETVNRWVRWHPAVRARLNEHRSAVANEHGEAVRRLRGKALAIVETHIDGGDVRAALHVLRLIGVVTGCDDESDAHAILRGAIDAEAGRANHQGLTDILGPQPEARRAARAVVIRQLAAATSEVK